MTSVQITIPQLSLVVLIGPSGSGKSTFARRHFLPTEILSSDACRAMISDDENNQQVTDEAFELLHNIAAHRLRLGRLVVVDATNVQLESRRPLVQLARQYHCLPIAIVLDLPEKLCHERNKARPDRSFGIHVVKRQRNDLRRSIGRLKREGFRHVFVLKSTEQVESAVVERVPLWNDRREERGPFDIIGDLHGCADELEELLEKLGYRLAPCEQADPLWGDHYYRHPEGRKVIFLGDLVDRGPRILDCVRIVRNMVHQGTALCVPGNHDMKLLRKLKGRNVQITHGLEASLAEIDPLPSETRDSFTRALTEFLDSLISHFVLDDGRLVVAHAGMKEEMQGRGSGRVREFALYGETTGETDQFGLPVRYQWAREYRGSATVVYGHTPVAQPEWLNRTINIDTGCVFGGALTALRYPERELVSVPAKATYCETTRPFLEEAQRASKRSAQQEHDDVIDAEDVIGKRIIPTRLHHNITIREENACAALELISRFAVRPQWLIYLPPTMSPCETSSRDGYLEYPDEAFEYYRNHGVPRVICQEKHMGSRAVVVVCRDEESACRRFGIDDGETGIVYTRTGRRFFDDLSLETELLARIREAMAAARFWDRFETTWACLDCELMPWSAKAQELLRTQYAAVGAAGSASLPTAVATLQQAAQRLAGPEKELAETAVSSFQQRHGQIDRFVAAYRNYCWPVNSLDDLKLAPFHLLATERQVHIDQTHDWHMEILGEICRHQQTMLLSTRHMVVDVTKDEQCERGRDWWLELTERGGEGMVIKPLEWIARSKRGLVQPAVKCRGREYLRIIYGPDYTEPAHLQRLKNRSLGRKRSLALREFALGIEALERFVRKEPLRRVHECVFGVLALESEPVDPRL